jgi:hypothetical protein
MEISAKIYPVLNQPAIREGVKLVSNALRKRSKEKGEGSNAKK